MFDAISDFFNNLLLYSAIFCAVSIVLVAITAFFIYRRLNRLVDTDISKLQAIYSNWQTENPGASRTRLVRRMVSRQAWRSGIVGALTSVGGFYTLPIMLPADILISTQIQAATVEFIAAAYGRKDANDVERRVRTYLVTTGGIRATESATGMMMKFGVRMLGKSFAKFIPIFGAVIGFAVNYAIAQTTGNLAISWYSSKPSTAPQIDMP